MSESVLEAMSREELLALIRQLLRINAEQQKRIEFLEQELARLRGVPASGQTSSSQTTAGQTSSGKTSKDVPAFVKPNVKKDRTQPKAPRKKRSHGFARRREEPTQTVDHAAEQCSGCGRKLSGGWVHDRRQVLEIQPVRVQVIEHRFLARHCGVCRRREIARPVRSGAVLGQSRIGVRLASYLCYLDAICRLPVASIQQLIQGSYGLHLSQGEIVRVHRAVAEAGRDAYQALLEEVRRSPVVHADETGARQDGQNGYVWSLSTPRVRFYHRAPSRAAAVIRELLGYEPVVGKSLQALQEAGQAYRAAERAGQGRRFLGKLVTDFYSAYSWYNGVHQRCLVHLDRDLDELREKHAAEPEVCQWVDRVLSVIQRAKDYAIEQRARQSVDAGPSDQRGSGNGAGSGARGQPPHGRLERRRHRLAWEQEMIELAGAYCQSALPQHVLAERIRKHLRELFVFVEYLDVPADNNPAERAIRPYVVQRKISGGTRSEHGSRTQVILLSLFQTWKLRGQDLLLACQEMIAGGSAPAIGRSPALS
jgi:transposase